MPALRILAVNWRDIGDPLGGGAEIHLHEILRRAVTAGHAVDLVVSAYPGAPSRETVDGVRIHRHGDWRLANWLLPAVARRLLRQQAYDLIVEDINKMPFFMPFHSRGVPVVAVVPHLFGSTVYREANPLAATYVWASERSIPLVYRGVDFEVISASTRDDLAARGVDPALVRVIHCGLDHDRLRLPRPPAREATPLIVTWSRLRRYKSVDVALRAFAAILSELPEARMLVMGRGPDEDRLRRVASRLGIGRRVEFLGHLPWPEMLGVLHRAHVCLNPSPKEGWGLTVVEANACGLPVVASDRPGLRDSVRDGETGLLVPYGDAAAFAGAAVRLLRDGALWARQSAAGRAWAATFSWERCARESLELFACASERRRHGRPARAGEERA